MDKNVDVLAVIDDFAEDYRTYIPQFHAQNRKRFKRKLSELNEARAAVAELTEALPDLMVLYRIKWGNTDPNALKVYERVEASLARVGGAK